MLPKLLTETEPDSGGNFTALESNSLLTASSLTGTADLAREAINLRRNTEYMMEASNTWRRKRRRRTRW